MKQIFGVFGTVKTQNTIIFHLTTFGPLYKNMPIFDVLLFSSF